MPRLSVFFIRLSLFYLIAGFSLGAMILTGKGIPAFSGFWSLLPLHIEFMLVGWILQFTMAVAFWMLPRLDRAKERGNEAIALFAFILLNSGLWLSALAQLAESGDPYVFFGRVCEFASAALFAIHAWPRVRPFGG